MLFYTFRKQVETSLKEAEKDNVHVPQTLEEYTATVKKQTKHSASNSEVDDVLDFDDDYMESTTEDEEEEDCIEEGSDEEMNCEVDSGTA